MVSPAEDLFAQAVELHRAGDLLQAEQLYRQVIDAHSQHAFAHCNLGVIFAKQGRHQEALNHYRTAIQLEPNYADAQFNLGNAYRALKQFAAAEEAYRAALKLDPQHVAASFNLGLTYWRQGAWEQAQSAFQYTLRLNPNLPEARNHLGYCYHRLGQLDRAIDTYQELIANNPQFIQGYHNLGLALAANRQYEESERVLRQALKIQPDYAEAHNSLGVTLEALGRADEALTHYERAVQLKPDFDDALNNLGIVYTELGRHNEAIECRRMALTLDPTKAHIHSNMLLTMNYSADITPEELFEEHKKWAEVQAVNEFTAHWHKAPVNWNPDRPLRIGYVSGDFRDHTVAAFLLPLFRHHDREQFPAFAFSNVQHADGVTEEIRSLVDDWCPIFGVPDEKVVGLIQERRVDILVDLSGHTAGNRLLVFARKPVPVQVALFGYPNTTGMSVIDYRFTDPYADPQNETEKFYTEQLVRLPNIAWCYQPPCSPDLEPLPYNKNRYITFGSLNNPAKLTTPMIQAWATILAKVPNSRLKVLTGRNGFGTAQLAERFAQHRIESERIDFVPRLPKDEYMRVYNTIDIHLDTYPYNGGITSCDAFWMGVPMVTLAGRTYVSRQGFTLLNNLGLKDWIAHSYEEYVTRATQLAEDITQLRMLRETLRERMQRSPITQVERYVRNLEQAYQRMWRAETLPRRG